MKHNITTSDIIKKVRKLSESGDLKRNTTRQYNFREQESAKDSIEKEFFDKEYNKIVTQKIHEALTKKSEKSNTPYYTIEQVYLRGIFSWDKAITKLTREEFAFNRVNSYISNGLAKQLDNDITHSDIHPIKYAYMHVHEVGGAGEEGTNKVVNKYKKDTPFSKNCKKHK